MENDSGGRGGENLRLYLHSMLDRVLFTHENGDFGAIFVTERSCAAPSRRVRT